MPIDPNFNEIPALKEVPEAMWFFEQVAAELLSMNDGDGMRYNSPFEMLGQLDYSCSKIRDNIYHVLEQHNYQSGHEMLFQELTVLAAKCFIGAFSCVPNFDDRLPAPPATVLPKNQWDPFNDDELNNHPFK